MPIVNPSASAPPAEKPAPVQINSPKYRGITVDTAYVPQSNLLTSIQGSKWTVSWLSAVNGADNELTGQQPGRNPSNQEYRIIHHLELKVQQDLVFTQDQDSKQMHVTGNAIVYPFLVPQEGDMFLAEINDGQEGIFQVTLSDRRTIFRESCHYIEYTLINYSTPELRGDLFRKVIEEYYFIRDFLLHGQNPVLLKRDYVDVQTLAERYFDMARIYFKMFTSQEYNTVVVPGQQARPTWDYFLTKACLSFFDVTMAPEIRDLRMYNCDDLDAYRCLTIWDALKERDRSMFPFMNKKAGLITTQAFTKKTMLEGVRYSGFRYVVYPGDPQVCIDGDIRPPSVCPSSTKLCPSKDPTGNLDLLLANKVLSGLPYSGAPVIKPVMVDDYYVFSQQFYENSGQQSMLELLVRDFLNRKALDRATLLLLTEVYPGFGTLERFYYIPIILALIRAEIRMV